MHRTFGYFEAQGLYCFPWMKLQEMNNVQEQSEMSLQRFTHLLHSFALLHFAFILKYVFVWEKKHLNVWSLGSGMVSEVSFLGHLQPSASPEGHKPRLVPSACAGVGSEFIHQGSQNKCLAAHAA